MGFLRATARLFHRYSTPAQNAKFLGWTGQSEVYRDSILLSLEAAGIFSPSRGSIKVPIACLVIVNVKTT
jgi:hypothetical protein